MSFVFSRKYQAKKSENEAIFMSTHRAELIYWIARDLRFL